MARDDRAGLLQRLFISFCLGALGMAVIVLILPGIEVDWHAFAFLELAVLWGVINAFLGTFLRLLTLPVRILTLGLFTIVVNGFLLVITAWISSTLNIDGFLPAMAGAIVLGIVNAVGNRVIHGRVESR